MDGSLCQSPDHGVVSCCAGIGRRYPRPVGRGRPSPPRGPGIGTLGHCPPIPRLGGGSLVLTCLRAHAVTRPSTMSTTPSAASSIPCTFIAPWLLPEK